MYHTLWSDGYEGLGLESELVGHVRNACIAHVAHEHSAGGIRHRRVCGLQRDEGAISSSG